MKTNKRTTKQPTKSRREPRSIEPVTTDATAPSSSAPESSSVEGPLDHHGQQIYVGDIVSDDIATGRVIATFGNGKQAQVVYRHLDWGMDTCEFSGEFCSQTAQDCTVLEHGSAAPARDSTVAEPPQARLYARHAMALLNAVIFIQEHCFSFDLLVPEICQDGVADGQLGKIFDHAVDLLHHTLARLSGYRELNDDFYRKRVAEQRRSINFRCPAELSRILEIREAK